MTDGYSPSHNGHAAQPDEADDDFFGSRKGIPGISFDEGQGYNLGTEWSGIVDWVGPKRQARAWNSESRRYDGPLKFYPDKNGQPTRDPIWEKPVTIVCDQVPEGQFTEDGEPDDRRRSIVFEGERAAALRKAMKDANAGRGNLRRGDWIALKWSGYGGPTGRRKIYTAQWAAAPEGADGFFGPEGSGSSSHEAQVQAQGAALRQSAGPQVDAQPVNGQSQPAASPPPAQPAPVQQQPAQPQRQPAAVGAARPPWAS
jgi:hypothetical protein